MSKKVWVQGAQPATCFELAIVSQEVGATFRRWQIAERSHAGVLIGDVALAFYSTPRFTDQLEFLFLSGATLPAKVLGFAPNDEPV